jgi:hypothetical protein
MGAILEADHQRSVDSMARTSAAVLKALTRK